jgi:hypothetical protein
MYVLFRPAGEKEHTKAKNRVLAYALRLSELQPAIEVTKVEGTIG